MKGIYRRILISSIITLSLLGLGVIPLMKLGETFTKLPVNEIINIGGKTLEGGVCFYGVFSIIALLVFCIKLGRQGVTEEYFEKKFFKGPSIILVRVAIILFVIFQGGTLYLKSQEYNEGILQEYNKIRNETQASVEMTILENKNGGISSYKDFKEKEELEELKKIYKISDNVKSVSYRLTYDESFLDVGLYIDFYEINEEVVLDSYKLSRFIKLEEKEVVSKNLIEKSLENYRNGNFKENKDIFSDGYLQTEAVIIGNSKTMDISLSEVYMGVRGDGDKK